MLKYRGFRQVDDIFNLDLRMQLNCKRRFLQGNVTREQQQNRLTTESRVASCCYLKVALISLSLKIGFNNNWAPLCVNSSLYSLALQPLRDVRRLKVWVAIFPAVPELFRDGYKCVNWHSS